MRGWHLKPLPAALLAATVAFELAAVGLSWDLESRYDTLLYAFYSVVQVAAGAFVASRHPRNPIGWLFCGFGALNALTADLAQGWGLRAAEQGWPGGSREGMLAEGMPQETMPDARECLQRRYDRHQLYIPPLQLYP